MTLVLVIAAIFLVAVMVVATLGSELRISRRRDEYVYKRDIVITRTTGQTVDLTGAKPRRSN